MRKTSSLIEPFEIEGKPFEGSPKLVMFLGISFMLLFTAYNQCQNLATQIYGQLGFENLGQIVVFMIYAFFALSNLVASSIKAKVTHRQGLLMGATCYVLLCVAGALASGCNQYGVNTGICSPASIYFTTILSSIILGWGASILWVSQASYVTECSTKDKLGEMNGIFWSIGETSFIAGAILSTVVLGYTSFFIFYIVMLILLLISLVIIILLPTPPKNTEFEGLNKNSQTHIKEDIKEFINTFKNKEMQPLFYMMLLGGIYIGFYATILTMVIESTIEEASVQEVNKLTGIVFIALGIGEISGGHIMGKILDKQSAKTALNIDCCLAFIAFAFTCLGYKYQSYNLCIFGGFFFGTCDVTCQVITSSLIAADFGGKLEGFTMIRFLESAGVVFVTIVSMNFKGDNLGTSLYIVAFILILCTIGVNQYKSRTK